MLSALTVLAMMVTRFTTPATLPVSDPNGNVVYYKRDEEDVYTFSIIGDEVKKSPPCLPF
jgi:hypothetical protein